MSVVVTAKVPAQGSLPFEYAIFERSPLGTLATAILLFAIQFGSFLVIAAAEHVVIVHRLGKLVVLTDAAWPAFVLSLLCCAALSTQRYARLSEERDAAAYAGILTGGMASAINITSTATRDTHGLRATFLGVVIGILISIAIRVAEFREGHIIPPLTMGWFAVTTIFLVVLLARGVDRARARNRSDVHLLNDQLKIDLLRTDTLAVLGRSAARAALMWFVLCAIACLFFIGGDLNWLTALQIIVCAVMGIGMFASIMIRIHRLIVQAKRTELENIRRRIDALRDSLHEDAYASARLHGLLAFEKRVSDAPEWPFDQTTAVRVGASALILTVPWFGQAIAAYLVEHLGHIAG